METDQKIKYLQMIDVFQSLSKDEMAEMDRTTTMSTCRRGKNFYHPEDSSEVLFILKKGLSPQPIVKKSPLQVK